MCALLAYFTSTVPADNISGPNVAESTSSPPGAERGLRAVHNGWSFISRFLTGNGGNGRCDVLASLARDQVPRSGSDHRLHSSFDKNEYSSHFVPVLQLTLILNFVTPVLGI